MLGRVLVLRVFSPKRSTAGAFAVPFRVKEGLCVILELIPLMCQNFSSLEYGNCRDFNPCANADAISFFI